MPETTVNVRPFLPGEWEIYKRLRLEALHTEPGMFFTSYADAVQRTDAEWQGMIGQPGICIFGVWDGSEAVGLTGIVQDRNDPNGRTGFLVMSYLRPAYRGRGLSRLLYQARIDWALAHTPWTTLVVSHRAGNEASRRANQAFGFQLVGKERIRWPDGAEAEEWKYRLAIRPRD